MTAASDRAERLREAIRRRKAVAKPVGEDLPLRPADVAPALGPLQRGLWLAHRLDPSSPAYHLVSAFRVTGELDTARLERAAGAVVARHRILRSTYRAAAGAVEQVVHPGTGVVLGRVESAPGEVVERATEVARQPFDLEAGPLVRLRLVVDPAGAERVLLLVVHHLLADESSLARLWSELAAAYRDGAASPGEPARQYDDFVAWQASQAEETARQQLDVWRRRLDPLPEDLRLPFAEEAGEGSRDGAGGAPGRLLRRPVDRALAEGVQRLATEAGITPFQVCAFAFQVLLTRYCEGRDVAFATPVSTRSHRSVAEMIGYFSNPVLLTGSVRESRPVRSELERFTAETREALAHSALPFQDLAESLATSTGRRPRVEAMFVLQQAAARPRLGTAELEAIELDLGAAKFDLTLFVTAGESGFGEGFTLGLEYRLDRFDEVWMKRLLGHYETLLGQLGADLGRRLAEVSLLTAEERRTLRQQACGPPLRAADDALLPARIARQAESGPEQTAVVAGGDRWSYQRLGAAAAAIATALGSRGVGPGDRVGIFVERSAPMVAAVVGTHWAGAAYVPLDPAYPPERNRTVLADAEVAVVLTGGAVGERLPSGGWRTLELEELAAGASPPAPVRVGPADPAYILYTSGSTGRPKGVVVTHGNLAASNAARTAAYDVRPRRFLLVPSIAFDSSVAGLFWALGTGGTLIIPADDESRDPRALARQVEADDVTALLAVPSLYGGMLAAGAERLAGLEAAIVAGESCPRHLVAEHFAALPGTRLFNEYGPTEGTVWATVHEMTQSDAGGPVPIGRPIPGVRVDVLDRLGRRVPAGIPGQAWIAGKTVARGYWRRPALSAGSFVPDAAGDASDAPSPGERRYRTGDRVAWTPDGDLLFLGRQDDQIKIRGLRIEPGEVEAALLAEPSIERAAVVARSFGSSAAAGRGQVDRGLVAFVEASAEPAGWRQELAGRLPAAMIPRRLVRLSELPRLPNGKIDTRRLEELELAPEVATPALGTAREALSSRQEALVSLWEGLLGRSGVGIEDNFFELGGHSLLVVEMTLAIERDFGVTLSSAEVFQNPTIALLDRRIDDGRTGDWTAYRHLFPLQTQGTGRPFVFAVPHFFSGLVASRFRGERPVYGLRGVSLRPQGNYRRWATMEDLGGELVDEMVRRFPGERFVVAGYSFGASMAFEAVRQMERRGIPVDRLILIAPMPLDMVRLGPLRLQLDDLRQPVGTLSAAQALGRWLRARHPFSRRLYTWLRHRMVVRPRRRLLCWLGANRRRRGLPLTPGILHADVRVERFRLHAGYRPGTVHTPTLFFNARETATDAAATWRPHFAGPWTVQPTPDPHLGDDSVEAAGRLILEHLDDLGKP